MITLNIINVLAYGTKIPKDKLVDYDVHQYRICVRYDTGTVPVPYLFLCLDSRERIVAVKGNSLEE